MTLSRMQELESLGFEWSFYSTACEDRLSELADYRKIHRHCNVPQLYSENSKLGRWVQKQRENYKLQQKGKKSHMTTFRIRKLESLAFEWDSLGAAWEDRLGELADYRKIQGHCNVPSRYKENTKLGKWVRTQRTQCRLRLERKKSNLTAL
jgi:hypothetical protein